jgi:two-component system, NarL family, nitrate/nitrite response regulator NarL
MVIANVATSPAVSGAAPAAQVNRPRVFIVSDVRLLCDGLVLSLSQQSSMIVVGSADLTNSSTHIAATHPDVVLLDVGAAGGFDMPLAFRRILPDLKVIAIAVNDVEQEVFACAEAGVSGFVSRNGSIQDLVAAIHCAVRNELVCSPRIAALLFSRVAAIETKRSADRDDGKLTRREHEIGLLMTRGLSNKEIARELRIQNATVKNHIHSILGKLQVRRRGEVAARMSSGSASYRGLPSTPDRHLRGSAPGTIAQLD